MDSHTKPLRSTYVVPRKPLPESVTTTFPDPETPSEKPSNSTKHSSRPSQVLKFHFSTSWLVAVLATIAYSLTVAYALGSTSVLQASWIALDPSRTLAILRALSEITALLVVAMVDGTAERLQWMLLTRKNGVPLPAFLSLGSGTRYLGMLQLLLRRNRGAHRWAFSRLSMLIAVPIMSVVLLSQVNTVLVFHVLNPFPVAAGVGRFDATFAELWQTIVPTYVTSDLSSLLQNHENAYPVSPITGHFNSCSGTGILKDNEQCGSSYFLHGGTKLVTPWPTENTSEPQASAYTLQNVIGLQLDFRPSSADLHFDTSQNCIVVGEDGAAIQICVSSAEDNVINSKFLHCPFTFQTNDSCLKDKTWQSYPGWTTSLQVYARRGTVHFSRSNLSSLAVTDLSAPHSADISSTDLLGVFKTVFGFSPSVGAVSGRPSTSALNFILYLSSYLTFAETSTPSSAEAGLYLRNLLVLPLFYFQPTYLSNITYNLDPGVDAHSILQGLPAEHYTQAAFAKPRYQLQVAVWAVLMYTCTMGLVILTCLTVAAVVSFRGSRGGAGAGVPSRTAWPVVDFVACCQGQDEEEKSLVERMRDVKRAEGGERAKLMEELWICLRK